MGITSRMAPSNLRENVADKLYRSERAYRLDKMVEKWSAISEVGRKIKNMGATDARNLAMHLENQAIHMSRMTETQMSQSFQGLSPENMLRLVRLAYPNSIRNKLFTEFAMESARDSIKYMRPVYTETQNGKNMDDRTFEEDKFNMNGDSNILGKNYRKAMYESTEDRYVHELANGAVVATVAADGDYITKNGDVKAGTNLVIFGAKKGEKSSFTELGYIDGYATIFGKDGEADPLATQVKRFAGENGEAAWLIKPNCGIEAVTKVEAGVFQITLKDVMMENPAYNAAFEAMADADFDALVDAGNADAVAYEPLRGVTAELIVDASAALNVTDLKVYGRFDSEGDFQGDYLGEVEIITDDYWFQPRPTSIGVTWSQLAELTMDMSFSVSTEEMLVDYAGQEIKKALDFRAVKIAYQTAKMNGADYTVTFNAAAADGSDDSYLATAQTFSQAIERVGDVMFNDISRGGVSRIVGGPAAISYLRLNNGFTTKGAQARIGGHQVGELYGIPVFKVPAKIIPEKELVCIWKNDQSEGDVSIAFGTLIPFFSTGVIQRKNFYKEAALATYGDWQVLNNRYLGIIKIENLRTLSA